jgi:transcriptional regulator with XRE-family HTH domain
LGDTFAGAVGASIRHARQRRGWTLRQVSGASNGRFKPSATAAYERGEREISLRRFCELATELGVPPAALLADALESMGRPGPHEVVVDLTKLSKIRNDEAEGVAQLLHEVAALRGEPDAPSVALRSGDLQILASIGGVELDELLARLGKAVHPDV